MKDPQVRSITRVCDRSQMQSILGEQRLFASTEWHQLVSFNPIFNGAHVFNLKHKTKQNQANSNTKELTYAS
jgi:hypothetical protein